MESLVFATTSIGPVVACCCEEIRNFLGLYGTDLQIGLLGAVYASIGLMIVAHLFNAVANLRRKKLMRPTKVHKSSRVFAFAAKASVFAQLLAFVTMLIPVVITAANFTMVLDDFLSRYFELPESLEAGLWQYKVFLGLAGVLLVAEIVRRRRTDKVNEQRQHEREWDEKAARAIENALKK